MTTLNAKQNASLARACTAVRMAIKMGIPLKEIRSLLNGKPQTAAANLGLTIGCDAAGVVTHDLADPRVVWHLNDVIQCRRTKADIMATLKDLRAECHASIDRANA